MMNKINGSLVKLKLSALCLMLLFIYSCGHDKAQENEKPTQPVSVPEQKSPDKLDQLNKELENVKLMIEIKEKEIKLNESEADKYAAAALKSKDITEREMASEKMKIAQDLFNKAIAEKKELEQKQAKMEGEIAELKKQ